MVQVTLTYPITITNTGTQHDVSVGVSLLNPDTGEELVMLPWWVVWDIPTGVQFTVTLSASGDLPPMNYLAICKAWAGHVPGTEVALIDNVGVVYQGGTGSLTPPILDEATQPLTISGPSIAVTINSFTITI